MEVGWSIRCGQSPNERPELAQAGPTAPPEKNYVIPGELLERESRLAESPPAFYPRIVPFSLSLYRPPTPGERDPSR